MNANQIIDALGGTSAVAKLCEVASPSVSQWREKGIPKARLMFLRLAKPDVFAAMDAQIEPVETGTQQEEAA